MAGLGIRLFTDEIIPSTVAPELRRRGYDVESCQEAGRSNRKLSDEEQLAYATQHGRAILSYNRDDFLRLDRVWKAAGRRHTGIIISREIKDLGTLLRAIQRHLDTYSQSEQHDVLLWLQQA